ncbi:MAG: hypothetical protein J7497_07810 [Chitinophagaceae bacterium]|nr:hypothetical protein [Chitinophagaceae bacterium]
MPENSSYNERELLYRIAEGDEAAFTDLLHKYTSSMAGIIQRIVRDEAAQQDILQDIFIKVWMHRDQLPEIEFLTAWLKKITLNEALQYLRRKNNNQTFVFPVGERYHNFLSTGT